MHRIEDLFSGELVPLIQERTNFDFFAPEEITKFQERLPNLDFSLPTEVPPAHLLKEDVAYLLAIPNQDTHGKYAQLVLLVYFLKAKIKYKRVSSNGYCAHVEWANDATFQTKVTR